MNKIRGNVIGTPLKPGESIVKATDLSEEQKAQARANIGAAGIEDTKVTVDSLWSSKNIVDKLCPTFTESGSVVACEPVEGYPLEVVSKIVPPQSGSGDPSPENVRPIESWTGANLWHGGKNLVNINNAVLRDGKTPMPVVDNGVVWKAGNTYFFYILFDTPIPAGTTLYCNWDSETDSLGNNVRYCNVFDETFSDVSTTAGPGGVMITAKPAYGLSLGKINGDMPVAEDIVISNIRVTAQVGEDYEPYRGEEFTADFGETHEGGGSYNWNTGVLTIDSAMVTLTGEEKYSQYLDYVYTTSVPTDAKVGPNSKVIGYCSHVPQDGTADGTLDKQMLYHAASNGGLQFTNLTTRWGLAEATVDAMKAFLAEQYAKGTPVQITYKMADPYTIRFDPQEILALSGVNTLYCDMGDTAVSGRADPTAIIERLSIAVTAMLEG